jgi:hypothetical protein
MLNYNKWKVKGDREINARSVIYFLRTSLQESENILWQSYNTIREIEYTNRILKTDLELRHIYHKKDESYMAHLHLRLLAYWVVNTVRYQLKKQKRIRPRPVTEERDCQDHEHAESRYHPCLKQIGGDYRNPPVHLPHRQSPAHLRQTRLTVCSVQKEKNVVHKTNFEKNYPAEYM